MTLSTNTSPGSVAIPADKILIVTKQSKYEYELKKFGLTHEQLCAKYSAEHANLKEILDSHQTQLAARAALAQRIPAHMMSMAELHDPITHYELVISLGGDNSFIYVTNYVTNALVAGVNSDPARSTGALCPWKNIDALVEQLAKSTGHIEDWTRLNATINNQPILSATSEYLFGERSRKDMTRHVLEYRGKTIEQKNSGIIIATGAGSTGWYESAARYLYPKGNQFSKTEPKAHFIVSEPYLYESKDTINAGELSEGETLTIHSLDDSDGHASIDSWHEHPFTRGMTAKITIGQPLRVLTPTKE